MILSFGRGREAPMKVPKLSAAELERAPHAAEAVQRSPAFQALLHYLRAHEDALELQGPPVSPPQSFHQSHIMVISASPPVVQALILLLLPQRHVQEGDKHMILIVVAHTSGRWKCFHGSGVSANKAMVVATNRAMRRLRKLMNKAHTPTPLGAVVQR
jgi:hypothetical protein